MYLELKVWNLSACGILALNEKTLSTAVAARLGRGLSNYYKTVVQEMPISTAMYDHLSGVGMPHA